jgi:hypothetical protein
MKRLIVSLALLVAATQAFAAPKPCEELKAEIAAKLDAKQVAGYTLTIVPNDQAKDGVVVGSCDGGTKKIVYEKK